MVILKFLTSHGDKLDQSQISFYQNFIKIYLFFCQVVFSLDIHESHDSRPRERLILTPPYHFHLLHEHLRISRAITPESSLRIWLVIGLARGTFGFRAKSLTTKLRAPDIPFCECQCLKYIFKDFERSWKRHEKWYKFSIRIMWLHL